MRILAMLIILWAAPVCAQDLYANLERNVQPDVDQYATPQEDVNRILRHLDLKPGEVFGELGSGDGRAAISAARDYGCEAWGIEKNPDRVALARRNAESAGVSHLVTFIEGDFNEIEWPYADVGFVYQFQEDLDPLRDKLLGMDRFASVAHRVGDLNMHSHDDGLFWTWEYDRAFVMWGSRQRTAANCNSGRCAMCNTIRAGLQEQRSHRDAVLSARAPAEAEYQWVRFCNGRRCWWQKVLVSD